MSEMIERVAKAICGNQPGAGGCGCKTHERPACDDFRWMAHAAIQALREPTEAMIVSGWATQTEPVYPTSTVDVWQAMIDEALRP